MMIAKITLRIIVLRKFDNKPDMLNPVSANSMEKD
jgi:hypothetical protein